MPDYDVIVIGGRPAGSTLAARLGRRGIRTLIVERAGFPSLPAASSPIIYAPVMKLLDEIGADEALYARGTPKIRRMVVKSALMDGAFPLPDMDGRDYAYAIDRARFDHALWETALRYPSVTGWLNFAVTDLLWDGDRVIGVVGRDATGGERGAERQITARLVIGADGRFSLVARKVEAPEFDVAEDYPTTLYYAYWRDLLPADDSGEPASAVYDGEYGIGYLVIDSADGTAAVCIEGQADLLEPAAGQAEAFYVERLMAQPDLARRLAGASRVTSVRGMRRIGNSYRQAGGPGWALVGDAYHQKDPLDGQGIYNAIFTAKALAWAITDWLRGDKSWEEAAAWYDETVRIRTYANYKSLLLRVRTSFYPAQVEVPAWMQKTLARWMMGDRAVLDTMGRFLTHQLPADAAWIMMPGLMARAAVRGGWRDLRDRFEAAVSGER
jgi:flavin-dependent dehydrogenase